MDGAGTDLRSNYLLNSTIAGRCNAGVHEGGSIN